MTTKKQEIQAGIDAIQAATDEAERDLAALQEGGVITLPGILPGGRIRKTGEVYGDRPASTSAELHEGEEWPGDDQVGSAGPPPGFEPDDPEGTPPPTFPPYTQEYQGNTSLPPEGFEEPDPDGPPPPDIAPTDPAYQGPDAVTPPGFEPVPQPGDPGFGGEELPPPPAPPPVPLVDGQPPVSNPPAIDPETGLPVKQPSNPLV